MKINLFTPPNFTKEPLDIEYLDNITNKKWQYSVSGRASIYHILKDLEVDKILIPIYICSTVLEPLKKLDIEPIFYDLDIEDLNPSFESIKFSSEKYDIKVILVASMYGNPVNLIEIEKYCKENDIFLIDDAAQSFGAKLNNKYIGTFGDAGFFSFSPGKPTAGHMGSFFWSKNDIQIKRTKHYIIHYLRWLDFKLNRYEIYENNNKIISKVINIFSRVLLKVINIYDDNICNFEKEIIGGILKEKFDFRKEYYNRFINKFYNNSYFRVIKNIRGKSNPHKIVILFNDKLIAKKFLEYMDENNISVLNGYPLLSDDNLPNAKSIDKKVVELPIEDDEKRMKYMFKKVDEFED
jgi:hypothetical protein